MNASRFMAMAILLVLARPAPAADLDVQSMIDRAAPGSIVHVPPGTCRGPLVIDRPLQLIADGRVIIDGGGEGDVVRITAPDVTLRGFHIRSTGISLDRENAGVTVLGERAVIEANVLEDVLFGVYLKRAGGSVVRGNTIGGKALDVPRRGDGIRIWYSPDVRIESNHVHRSRDVVMWFSPRVVLRGNRVTEGRYGLHFMYSDDNVLEANHLEGNSVGAFLMYSRRLEVRGNVFARNRGPSGYGLGLKDMDGVLAEENLFLANRVGVYLDNSPGSIDVRDELRRNVFAFNEIGVAFMPSVRRNDFHENAFIENQQQVAVLGTGTFEGNRFTVDGTGNFWSDYRGYDLGGDGVGDLPYASTSLFGNLMEREPKLRLFLHSPVQQAIDLAARAVPVVQPQPRFEDTAPRMQPVHIDVTWRHASSPWPLAAVALGLVGGAAIVLLGGLPQRAPLVTKETTP